MNVKKQYLRMLRECRPNQYKRLRENGELDSHAAKVEQNYLEAKKRYQDNGLMPTEAMEAASNDWLEPMSEQDEQEESQRIRELENQEEQQQATNLVAGTQGYDPKNKKRQQVQMPDGRTLVSYGNNREIIYPAGTSFRS